MPELSSPLPSPDAVLDYWIGSAAEDSQAATQKNALWFGKSFATDRYIADNFLPLLPALANGLAGDWAAQGPRQRLAAIITLDQFSRNLFRGHALSFRHDALALGLTKDSLDSGEDKDMSEAERIFLYLPLEHSEDLADQDISVSRYEELTRSARPEFKPLCDSTLDYAVKHRDVIVQFGRFPHRNGVLKRADTPEEQTYLAQPGAGF